jgi:hypothetical protein
MSRILVTPLVAFCAFAMAVDSVQAQEEYSLQYRFVKGKTYRLSDSLDLKSTQEMMGQEMKSTSTILMTTKLVAADVDDNGSTVLTISPEALKLSVKSPQMDTTMSPQEPIGKRSRVTVSRLGELSRREVVDTVKMTGIMRVLSQRETVRFHIFAGRPVKVGGTWTSTKVDTMDTMGSKVSTTTTTNYTILSREKLGGRDCLKISFTGKSTFSGKGSMMGGEFFLEGSGTTSGAVFVDPANGLPLSEDLASETETTVALTGQQKMTIPGSQSMTLHRVLQVD